MESKTLDAMTLFICTLVILSLICLWLLININIIFKLIITVVLLFSLYYQVMTSRQGLSHMTIVMNIEDRIMNEIAYQVTKRGYYIKFEIKEKKTSADFKKPSVKWIKYSLSEKFIDVEDNFYLSVVKCNMPTSKRKWVKFISFLNVIARPAWAYREFKEEEDIMYNEDRHNTLINARSV
jgi:hypothetical protein